MSYQGSQVFYPYRSIGLYSSSVPFDLQKQGTVHWATVPVQNTYQLFRCDNLKVVNVGEQFESSVKVLVVHGQSTFVGVGNNIHICVRGKKVGTLSGHTGKISTLLVLGNYLLSYSNIDKTMKLWDYAQTTLCSSIELPEYYDVTAIMHPDTYLNKVLIATKQGPLYLWNIRTQKLIYTFDGWNSAVSAVVQSPAVDVVAIGLDDGRIVMHNLKLDKTLFTFKQVGTVTGLSFRTDGHNFMVSGTASGNIVVWNLEKRVMVTQYQSAHRGPVTTLRFFEREPLLMTSGTDNSLKIWIFDQLNGSPRLLKQRSGHSKPPTQISFWLRSSQILSSAQDGSLRYFALTKDQQSRELSQGSLASQSRKQNRDIEDLRLSPINHFVASPMKLRRWDNILSCHRGEAKARTWSVAKWSLGTNQFVSKSPEPTTITSVAITNCGNFGIIGAKSGWIDQYNLQSGIHRGQFTGPDGHKAEITGLEITQLNNVLISASLDGTIKLWDLQTHALLHTIEMPGVMPITMIKLNKETNLLAVVGDDFHVRLYDCSTRNLVRVFKGHQTAISDISFSSTARWLVTASGMDCEVRVWDVPSGRCIDWFLTESPITSLSLSPNGDFLATSHAGEKGISIWANGLYFSNLFLKPLPPKPTLITGPTLAGPVNTDDADDDVEGVDLDEELWKWYKEDKEQLDPSLITFSSQPKSVWHTLLNLETIKERNKSQVEPEAPKDAPFILSSTVTAPGKAPVFTKAVVNEATGVSSRILDFNALRPKTKFVSLLERAAREGDYHPVTEHLKSVSPSAIDYEIRSLSGEDEGEEMELFLLFCKNQLEANTNFELVQAYLNVFYKAHWEFLQTEERLLQLVKEIKDCHKKQWRELLALFDSNLCLLSYFGDAFAT
eukprot:TRINITY_DN11347_c0_g1_i1.p1 TRINITY_DN11347_c0_g1~~TRINITY_DN11347_c0_g1_i1.p1  ORF type:complete len:891 (+),score=165.54 TRINITY_DN11347_c0_g1_i1:16-2688(+)